MSETDDLFDDEGEEAPLPLPVWMLQAVALGAFPFALAVLLWAVIRNLA